MNRRKTYLFVLGISLSALYCLVACTDTIQFEGEKANSSDENSINNKDDSLKSNQNNDSLNLGETIKPDYPYPIQPSKENWQEDIGEVFLMLPDTIFINEAMFGHDFKYLTHSLKKNLVQHKKILIEKLDCSIQLSKDCKNNECNCVSKDRTQMAIVFGCHNDNSGDCITDNVSKFYLRGWKKKDGSLIFTVNIGSAHFDFDESTLFILEPLPNGWKDVTQKYVNLTVKDFVDEAYFNIKHIKGNDNKELQRKIISPPIYINEGQVYSTNTMQLRLHEYILYLEFESLDEGHEKNITDYIKYDYVNLMWNGETFEKQFGKWKD